jgi:Icc-related predicted phosphoesterase
MKTNFEKVIGVAGDWHGNTEWAMNALRKFAARDIHTVLHVGDFGIWPGESGANYIRKVQKIAAQLDITLYVTPGNHEDYVRIEATEIAADGFQHYRENILLAPRGHRWEWHGRSFVSLGGANSIDREHRSVGINWWPEEQISLGDVYRSIEGGHADIMITHEAPRGVQVLRHGESDHGWSGAGLAYARLSSDVIRQAVDHIKPDILFHGHYHWFHDTHATLYDGLDHYTTQVIGLDKDENDNNIGMFNLETMAFNLIPWKE